MTGEGKNAYDDFFDFDDDTPTQVDEPIFINEASEGKETITLDEFNEKINSLIGVLDYNDDNFVYDSDIASITKFIKTIDGDQVDFSEVIQKIIYCLRFRKEETIEERVSEINNDLHQKILKKSFKNEEELKEVFDMLQKIIEDKKQKEILKTIIPTIEKQCDTLIENGNGFPLDQMQSELSQYGVPLSRNDFCIEIRKCLSIWKKLTNTGIMCAKRMNDKIKNIQSIEFKNENLEKRDIIEALHNIYLQIDYDNFFSRNNNNILEHRKAIIDTDEKTIHNEIDKVVNTKKGEKFFGYSRVFSYSQEKLDGIIESMSKHINTLDTIKTTTLSNALSNNGTETSELIPPKYVDYNMLDNISNDIDLKNVNNEITRLNKILDKYTKANEEISIKVAELEKKKRRWSLNGNKNIQQQIDKLNENLIPLEKWNETENKLNEQLTIKNQLETGISNYLSNPTYRENGALKPYIAITDDGLRFLEDAEKCFKTSDFEDYFNELKAEGTKLKYDLSSCSDIEELKNKIEDLKEWKKKLDIGDIKKKVHTHRKEAISGYIQDHETITKSLEEDAKSLQSFVSNVTWRDY